MATQQEVSLNSALRTLDIGGMRNMSADPNNYKPAQLTNFLTGKREEILLIDPQDEAFERGLLADVGHNPELHADLSAALSAFSPVEKRIIFRVLVQGQSVEEATKRTTKSSRYWERWLVDYALPILCTMLEDYREELEKVGIYIPQGPNIGESECFEFPPAESRFKCRNCGHVADTFQELRDHNEDNHTAYYLDVQNSLKDSSDEIMREKRNLREFGRGKE